MTGPVRQPDRPADQTSEDRFDDLVEEVTERLEAGESVDPGNFLHYGPALVERLRHLLPTLQALALLQSARGSGPRLVRMAMLPPAALAKELGDFQLEDELGRGGMGIVFAAEQRSLARRVAVKVLPSAGLLSEVALDRFRTEARAAASLAHEHIVPVYAVGCERGIHFYAMKFVDGCTLADVIRERRQGESREGDAPAELRPADETIPLNNAALVTRAIQKESDWYRSIARLGIQAAKALAHAHAQGIVHRDIKPSNLLIDKTGRLWLSDFGLARLEIDAGLTRTGDLLGTLRYMSPEQALGQSSELDARADIYSLGATLYECLTLRPVIPAAKRSEIFRQATDPHIPRLRSHDPNIPESLERIILKCLRTDPAQRYASANNLAADLDRYLHGEKVQARLPSPYQRARQWVARHPTTMLIAVATFATTSAFLLALALYVWSADARLRGPPIARGSPPVQSPSLVPLDSIPSSESPTMPRAKSRPAQSASSGQNRRRLFLEPLEVRTLMAGDIAISDAAAIEGGGQLKFIDTFAEEGSGGLARPRCFLFGPDGNGDGVSDLYVSNADTNEILRFDGATGAFIDVFVASGSGGLNSPADFRFTSDGSLYVNSFLGNQLLRYDGTTGAFIDVITDGLNGPLGMALDATGNIYISNWNGDDVLRYDGVALSTFITAGSHGLDGPRHAVFGPDANNDGTSDLYVSSQFTNQVLRYDGVTGAYIDVFLTTPYPTSWLEFGADGVLYRTTRDSPSAVYHFVERFDPATGALIDRVDTQGGWSFVIGPDGLIYKSGNASFDCIVRFGADSLAAFTVSLSSPSDDEVTVDYVTNNGSADENDFDDAIGTVTFAPGQTSQTILVQSVNDDTIEPNQSFSVSLLNPIGGVIVDGTGTGTIIDDDTKFYVVDDATANRTFEYGSGAGLAGENYLLSTGNTAPRGAASTAAGDKVWVVDANKSVYVYGSAGNLLGSWTATGTGLSQPEGIATNGTDIWIVDASADKVFKFAGAASRLSGTQAAVTDAKQSFKLNSGNKDARDIVTDGTHLWVVNNSSTDKVFKYALNGSLAGSWTISGGGGSPTGITLDPSSPSHLWIVDNSTDSVSQYDNAVGRTSGSQGASGSFTLVGGSSGNLNPQGIADPPVSGSPALDVSPASTAEQPAFADLLFSDLRPSRDATQRPTRKLSQPVVSTAPVVPIRTVDIDRPQVIDEALRDYLREEEGSGEIDISRWALAHGSSEEETAR